MLDEKEVERILGDYRHYSAPEDLSTESAITEISKLQPNNQEVILSGIVDEDGYIEDIQVGKNYKGKEVKIILEEKQCK